MLPLELHKVSRVAAQLQVLQPVGLPRLRHRLLRPHVRHGADLRRRDCWNPGSTLFVLILFPTSILLAAPSGKLRLLCQPRGQLGKRLSSPDHPYCHERHTGWNLGTSFRNNS